MRSHLRRIRLSAALLITAACGGDVDVLGTGGAGASSISATASTSSAGASGVGGTDVGSGGASGEGGAVASTGLGGAGGAGAGGLGGAAGSSTSGVSTGAGGEGGGLPVGEVVADLSLVDVNPASARYEEPVSPRDYLEMVSGWYFGHAT